MTTLAQRALAGAAALAVGVLAIVAGRGAADAAETTVTVTPSVEAWFQPNPTCGLPVSCITPATLFALLPVSLPVPIPDVSLSPYPDGTLHVAYSAQRETARAYLALPREKLDGEILAATLNIPLDVSPASGSVTPERAKAQVCLFSTDVKAVAGSIENPPTAICDGSAPLKYVATPKPHLTASLEGLRAGLRTTTGVAILPDARGATAADAWRIVFSSHTRGAATPPATLTAVVRPVVDTPEAPFDEVLDEVPFADVFGDDTAVPRPVSEAPAGEEVALAPSTPATTVTVGYAYGVVWFLPLLALVLAPAIARALTKDLRRAP